MTSHSCGVLIKLPFYEVVPFPQSGHQGLIVGGEEPYMLLLLLKLSLQAVTLERPLVNKSLIARVTRKPTLSLSLASITHSRIDTVSEPLYSSAPNVLLSVF